MPRPPNDLERAYLQSRGYNHALLQTEGVLILEDETFQADGVITQATLPRILWKSTAMSGQTIGYQTRELIDKSYRWYQAKNAQHLPIIYATEEDHQILYDTGEMILTEGIFDRIAIKRCLPHMAVYARLSKGAANQLTTFLRRYTKRLWLCFDMDKPGEDATRNTEQRLSIHLQVYSLRIPYKDPSEYFEKRGLGPMRMHLKKQMERSAL